MYSKQRNLTFLCEETIDRSIENVRQVRAKSNDFACRRSLKVMIKIERRRGETASDEYRVGWWWSNLYRMIEFLPWRNDINDLSKYSKRALWLIFLPRRERVEWGARERASTSPSSICFPFSFICLAWGQSKEQRRWRFTCIYHHYERAPPIQFFLLLLGQRSICMFSANAYICIQQRGEVRSPKPAVVVVVVVIIIVGLAPLSLPIDRYLSTFFSGAYVLFGGSSACLVPCALVNPLSFISSLLYTCACVSIAQ